MKINATKRVLAMLLALAMLLPSLADIAAYTVSAASTDYTYGTANVYDIYDLTGSKTNTIKGTNDTWDGQIHANVSAEHKENMAFKTILNAENISNNSSDLQQIRLSLNALDGANIYDPSGYSVFINHNGGAPYIAIKRNMQDLVVGHPAAVAGTWELEIGIVDILDGSTRVGKHLYVKKDGETVCEVDDTNGYLTGDALGTKIVDFHYGAAIQMDTTYETTYGTPTVYDIFDLTGAKTNTVTGTGDGNWDGVVLDSVSADHKENMAFKTKLTMVAQEVRLSLNAKDGLTQDQIWNAPGYAVYLYGASNEVDIRRNNTSLKKVTLDESFASKEIVFEAGIVDILFGGEQVGKHLYVKMDDVVVCEYDDTSDYLTGDTLGTKIIDFHYGAAIQMDTAYEVAYVGANVHDLWHLTGGFEGGIFETSVNAWASTKLGSIAEANKEQAAIRMPMNITDARHRYRFSVGAAEGVDCTDPMGYGLEIAVQFDGNNYVKFLRNNSEIAIFEDVSQLIGDRILEFGYRTITVNGTTIGKQVYLAVDGADLYTYEDLDSYLTGDTLGTMVAMHHIDDAAVTLSSLYDSDYSVNTDTAPQTYDIYDITGSETNTVNGTGAGDWDGVILGAVNADHKESMAFKTMLTMGEQEVRLSLNALDDLTTEEVQDPTGYAVYINHNSGAPYISIRRNNADLVVGSVASVADTWKLEIGIVNILAQVDGVSTVVGKHLYVKQDDAVVCEYDDFFGFLTGETLGTNLIDFHYGAAIQMDTTYSDTHGTANVYDIYDLTGSATNTVNGTDNAGHWNGLEVAKISAEHKENMAFKTMLTMNVDYVRLSLNALEGANKVDPTGYAVYIVHNGGAPYIAIKKNQEDLAVGSVSSVQGTHKLEIGIVDILTGGTRTGKHLYVKLDDALVCEVDDTDGYLTGEALGTMIADFHVGADIQMDTTYESSYGTVKTYDIYDLTGATTNTYNGTGNGNWSTSVIGNIEAADKESVSLKANVNITEEKEYRFSLGALDSDECIDPAGYGMYLTIGTSGKVMFTRGSSHTNIKEWNVDTTNLKGEYLLEFGYRDITFNGNVIGKQVFLMKDGEVLYSYEDTEGYLTGNALGTKAAVFHYGTAIQMDTTYESTYGTAKVYDIYDLTGSTATSVNAWASTKLGSFAETDKEQAAVRLNMNITDARHRYRFSVGAAEGVDCTDLKGYGLEIAVQFDGNNYVAFNREGTGALATFNDVSALIGDNDYEFGYRNILFNGNVVGKQVYLSVNGEDVYTYDDTSGYLTGSALGTMVALHHIDDSAVQLSSTYETSYGTVKTYDVWELTGSNSNTYYGTTGSSVGGHDEWVGTTIGNVSAAYKENVGFKARVTIPTGTTGARFSLGALDSANPVDCAGYALSLTDSGFTFYRNNTGIYTGTTAMTGTYVLEFSIQDVIINGKVISKRLTLKKDGEVVGTYDDASGFLTGDALGTKAAVFLYGPSIQMDTTLPAFVYGYNLTLGGSTVMNFWLDPAVVTDSASTVAVAVNGVETATYAFQDIALNAEGYRKVSVPLAAAQLNDPVAVTVTSTDGESATRTYTVVGYANYICNGSYTAEEKAVVEALLHYGAAAQTHFGYNTENLANTGYTDTVTNTIASAAAATKTGSVEGVTLYGSTLLFEESITLRHYLNITGDVSSYTFIFNDDEVTPVKSSKYGDNANYYVALPEILPNELDDLYTMSVTDGTDTFTYAYSPTSYLLRMSTKGRDTQKALIQQLYDYHIAVKALASSKTVDTPVVLDLYEISGKTSIKIPASAVQPLGLLVGTDDSFVEKELTNNVAIRFKYTGGEGMRIQLGASTQEISSVSGALFMSVPDNNSFGIANISDNGTWVKDSSSNDLFSWQSCLGRDQISYIELGCVKRYTDGVYTHDRYYVRAAASVAELDSMVKDGTFSVYYDTTMRDNNGYKVIARSRMDNGGDVLATTWTDTEIAAYEAKLSTLAQNATSGTYDALEEKYADTAADNKNTAASLAAAKNPDPTTATGGDELILWAESGVSKIVQDDDGKAATLASSKSTLSIQMAKGEYEGAQLMLFGNRNVGSYEVFVTDLTNGSKTITADNIHLYQLKYLTVDDKASGSSYNTPSAYSGEKLPDAMLPFAKAVEYGENSILAGNNQAIYVDVATKSTDAAGTYTGTIVVKTESHVYTLPISVTVGDVTMPETSKLGTYAPYLGRDAFTSGELDGSDEMAALYVQTLQDFNMSSIVPESDDVLNIEKFLVNVRRNYDSMTNYILPVDTNDSYYTVNGTNTAVYCNYALLKEYVVALAKMSVADGKNYLDKAFFYPSDHVDESKTEAEFNLAKATYAAYCQMLDDADAELTAIYSDTSLYTSDIQSSVKNLRFLLTIPGDDDSGKSLDVGELLTDFLTSADRKNVILCTTNEVLVRDGYGDDVATAMNGAYADELWTYLCLKPYTPYSNYAFDTPVVGLRTLGWTCYQENVDTLMTYKSVDYLYGTDGLSLDRWTTSSAGKSTPTPGDGNIFYPGAKYGIDGPCPSLRAVAWRDGVDDYSLMSAVAENGGTNLGSLYSLITETYKDSIKASSETGSWWGSLISKNVNATVPIDDDAKFAIARNALLQMAASDASQHAAILSNAQSAINSVATATGTTTALEAAGSESTATISSNVYTNGYYQLADFESYAETVQNKFSGNAKLSLSSTAANGSRSLKVAVQPGQKGETVWIPTTSKYFSATTNFSGASKITFKVYNAQSTDRTVRFYLNTYDRSGDVYNAGTYLKDSADVWHDDHPSNKSFRFTLTSGWNEITINAADIGTDYLSCVGAFIIAFDSGVGYDARQVFYLDDVRVYMNQVS